MSDKPYEIKIVISFTATPDEFWADGYGPEDPTLEQVIAAVKEAYATPQELASDYDGEGSVSVTIDGKDVYDRADTGSD